MSEKKEAITEEDVRLVLRLARYTAEATPEAGTREDDDATPYFQAQIDAIALADKLARLKARASRLRRRG